MDWLRDDRPWPTERQDLRNCGAIRILYICPGHSSFSLRRLGADNQRQSRARGCWDWIYHQDGQEISGRVSPQIHYWQNNTLILWDGIEWMNGAQTNMERCVTLRDPQTNSFLKKFPISQDWPKHALNLLIPWNMCQKRCSIISRNGFQNPGWEFWPEALFMPTECSSLQKCLMLWITFIIGKPFRCLYLMWTQLPCSIVGGSIQILHKTLVS